MLNQPPQANPEHYSGAPGSTNNDFPNPYENTAFMYSSQPGSEPQQFGVMPPPSFGNSYAVPLNSMTPFAVTVPDTLQGSSVEPSQSVDRGGFMNLDNSRGASTAVIAADEWVEQHSHNREEPIREDHNREERSGSRLRKRLSRDRTSRHDRTPERYRSRERDRRNPRRSRSGGDRRGDDYHRDGRSSRGRRNRSTDEDRSTRALKHEKPRKPQKKTFKYWDVPPRGFEHITPMQYKQMQGAGQIPQLLVDRDLAINTAAATPVLGSHVVHQSRRL